MIFMTRFQRAESYCLAGGRVILDLFVKSLPSWCGSENLDQ